MPRRLAGGGSGRGGVFSGSSNLSLWHLADPVWAIGDLIEAALGAVPPPPSPTAPERAVSSGVVEGGKTD
jgi:hypothetical protein